MWATAALALAALLARAAAAEPVTVRAVIHPGYGRLVFEWASRIEVETRRSADRPTLPFARLVAADLEPAAGRLRDYLVELTRAPTSARSCCGCCRRSRPSSRFTKIASWRSI